MLFNARKWRVSGTLLMSALLLEITGENGDGINNVVYLNNYRYGCMRYNDFP